MAEKFDFCGWATRNDILCSDGRTIRKDAFKDNDGQIVPLVWNHQHNAPSFVIGHALLENRDEGVYVYGSLNDTQSGQDAKEMIRHGDIKALSIYANKLKQKGGDVIHGAIREVSLVLAGANIGAYIEQVIQHGERMEGEAIVYTGMDIEEVLEHAEESEVVEEQEETVEHAEEKLEETTEEVIEHAEEPKEEKKEMADTNEKTVKDVFDSMTEEQKNLVYYLVGQAAEDAKDGEDKEGDNEEMKHNVFENETNEAVLSHADMEMIMNDAKRLGSLKESFLQHAEDTGVEGLTYGVGNIDYLFPDARTEGGIQYIKRRTDWVAEVMNGVHRSPMSRIKCIYADLTPDEARAKGYIKGKLKKEQVFGLLKRSTTPTTVYKKQKLDRDDVVDITDFDIVAELKTEMRIMLDEELARCILIGDGRGAESQDKVDETCIRPIWTDAELFTIKHKIDAASGATNAEKASAMVDAAVIAMDEYEGSGNPTMYASQNWVTQCLLLKDANGRRIYKDLTELASAMSVGKIVPVPVMKGKSRTDSDGTFALAGLIVNLDDYSVGADKGGSVNMFDDFDIDYNQMKYLIETRCSGSLTKPHAAIALEFQTA